jgi:hypothetical protein
MDIDKKSDVPIALNETLSDHSSITKGITVHNIDPFEDSPIEEVRASVPPTDDPSLPAATFRSWFWGIVFSAAISFTNQVSFCSYDLLSNSEHSSCPFFF